MSEQFDVILGGLDTEVDVTIADSTGVDPSVLLALRGEKGDKGDTGAAGQDGADGADGFSPIATVSKVGDTATISITDENGTTTATVADGTDGQDGVDGADGQDGVSPSATVSKAGDTATITITDVNGTTTATISDGTDGVDGTDGQDGADGFSPIATVTKSGDTATITITDKNGTTTATVQDGTQANVFTAEFNVTTYADVKDAYDDDAILICTVDDSGNTVVLQLVYFDATNEIFYFAEPNGDGWYWTELSNANGWDDGTRYLASTDVATQLADGLMSALDKQKLDGLSKRNIWYGTCSTSASQSPKAITTASGDFSLTTGNMLCVLFSHTNSLSSASLQVDGGTSKSAYPMDGTSDISNRWGSNELVMFAYDGTKFIMLEQGKASTTAYGITKLNNTTSSTSTSEAATANAVKEAYDHGGVQSVNGSTGAVTVTVPTITDTYDGTSSDGMSGKAVKQAIDALDGTVSGTAGSGKTLTAFSQTDGKVNATFGNISITKSQVSDFPTLATVATSGDYDDLTDKPAIHNVPSGGSSGQVLSKASGTDYDLAWVNQGGGGGSVTDVEVDGTSVVTGGVAEIDLTGKSDVGHTHTTSEITDFPTIPSDTGDLTNGAGFITSSDIPVTDVEVNGTSVLSGTVAAVTVPTTASLINVFYPVGSYYETSDTAFDPNISWGGTWQLETEGQFHISAGTNYTVAGALANTSDGGSPYIQAHTHGFTKPTVSGNQPVYGSKNAASGSARYALTASVTTDNFGRGGTYTVSGGSVNAVSGATTGNAGNMPPYIIVNRWHRTA